MESSEQTDFGELLKTYRTRARKTQQQLAECLGINRRMVIKWEQGGALPKDRARIEEVRRCLQLTVTERDSLLHAALLVAPQQIWHVPILRTLFFTGRKEMLEQLPKLLTTQKKVVRTLALTGLGGIGKTQTAREYIHRYQLKYQAVLWVQADSQEVLVSSVLALAQKLNLSQQDAKVEEQILEAFKQWLEIHSGWLLILDNVEELPLIQALLPTRGRGQVLITTRSQAVGTLAHPLALKPFPPQVGMRLLLRRANLLPSPANMKEATAISKTLGGLPLALDQAGAFVQETGHTLAEYQMLFVEAKGVLLSRRGTEATDHRDSVAVTFELAFAKVQQASPAAGELLRLCAFLAPEAIPEELFTEGGDALPPNLRETLALPLGWQEVVGVLRRYSLLEREAETKTLSLHRLVQDVLCEELDQDSQRQWAERVVCLVSNAFPRVVVSKYGQCQRVLSDALVCTCHVEHWAFTFPEATRLLNRVGVYLMERSQYREAKPILERALEIREQLNPVHPDVAESQNNLALLYYAQGKFKAAEPLFLKALAIREQALGRDHLYVAYTLNNLAIFYKDQGKYAETELLYQRALRIWEHALGPDHYEVAYALTNLASLYFDMGKYVEAKSLYRRAKKLREQGYGLDSSMVAWPLNGLGEIYREQGKYMVAEKLFQRALHLWEQPPGSDNPEVVYPLHGLAELYRKWGKFEAAEPLLKRAKDTVERIRGVEHPEKAYALQGLAELYRDKGQYDKALPLAQQALEIREQELGFDHPLTAQSLNTLASIYQAQGQYPLALPLLEQALEIWAQKLPNHPNTATCLRNLITLLREIGQEARARALELRFEGI